MALCAHLAWPCCCLRHDPALAAHAALLKRPKASAQHVERVYVVTAAAGCGKWHMQTALSESKHCTLHDAETDSGRCQQNSDQHQHGPHHPDCGNRTSDEATPKTNTARAQQQDANSSSSGSSSQQHHQQQQQRGQEHSRQAAAGALGPDSKLLVNPLQLIFGKAWRKAVPLSVLFFASTFIFTMLQSLKDGIVVMTMGADALPFLATFGTLPASLAFFTFYKTVLVPHVRPQHLFYATAAPLLAFYALFAVVLYPVAPALQNPSWLAWLPGVLPAGLQGLAAMVQYWLYSLFYVAGELWGPVMISLAFWSVADDVCSLSEAAQLYPQLGLLANLGLVGSGRFIQAVHHMVGSTGGAQGMAAVLKVLVGCMLATSVVMFLCKMHINKSYFSLTEHVPYSHQTSSQQQQQHHNERRQQHRQHHAPDASQCIAAVPNAGVATGRTQNRLSMLALSSIPFSTSNTNSSSADGQLHNSSSQQQQHVQATRHAPQQPVSSPSRRQQQPGRASLREVLGILQHNSTAAALATTVVGFSIAYRMYEYSFKAQLQLFAVDSVSYCCRLAEVQSAVGTATLGMMLGARLIFKYCGWSGAALISPWSMLITGAAFFASSLWAQAATAAMPVPPAAVAALASSSGVAPTAAVVIQQLLYSITHWLSNNLSFVQGPSASAALGAAGGAGQQQLIMNVALAAGFATALASCACHNSLFTPCKQMVYKTLPAHQVNESKAAVDLVGGQFAKSAAGWLVQLLLLSYGNITAALPACFGIFVAAILAWLKATTHLSKQMKQHEQHMQEQTTPQHQQVPYSVLQQPQERYMQPIDQQQLLQLHQQQQQDSRWPLPLPRDLAVAAAAAVPDHWPRLAVHTADADTALAAVSSGSSSSSSGSGNVFGEGVRLQPYMVQDAQYWDRMFAALADSPLLLDSVVVGHSLEPSAVLSRDEQQQQQHARPPVTTARPGEGVPSIQALKQALHTTFEA